MHRISVELDAAESEVHATIHSGLLAYNEAFAGPHGTRRFAVLARDEAGTGVGGLEGELRWGWLHVDNFWLPQHLRGQGLGSMLLRRAEEVALEHGCTRSHLDTFEFQALPFYERHGYTVFGVLEDYPPGFRRYYLQKMLAPATPPPAEAADG